MERELKIVVSIFLVYLIFGLTQFFISASIITPIFLNFIVAGVVSLVIFLMNLKQPKSFVLLLYFVGLNCYGLGDDLSRQFIVYRTHWEWLNTLVETTWFGWVALSLFYLAIISGTVLLHLSVKNKGLTAILLTLLSVHLLLYGYELFELQFLTLSLFFVIFFIITQRSSKVQLTVIRALSAQFLLLVILEGFRYLAFV